MCLERQAVSLGVDTTCFKTVSAACRNVFLTSDMGMLDGSAGDGHSDALQDSRSFCRKLLCDSFANKKVEIEHGIGL